MEEPVFQGPKKIPCVQTSLEPELCVSILCKYMRRKDGVVTSAAGNQKKNASGAVVDKEAQEHAGSAAVDFVDGAGDQANMQN